MFSKRIIFLIFLLSTLEQLEAENDISISSLIFFDATYAPESSSKTSSFNVTRSYLNFRKTFFDNFHTRVTIDAGKTDSDSRQTFFLKYAYLEWKISIGTLVIGMQPTNYFGSTTTTWGMRYIEKFPTDLYGYDPTSDLGISLKKLIWGKFIVHGAVYNGGGYKKKETDSFKRASILISAGEQKLNINAGRNGGFMFSNESYEHSDNKVATKNRISVFGGIATNKLRFGTEFAKQSDSGSGNDQILFTIYGNYFITKTTRVFIRGDTIESSNKEDINWENHTILGVTYEPNSSVAVSPNLRISNYESNSIDSELFYKLNFQFKF